MSENRVYPQEALAVWSRCCEEAGLTWYLYADTLLCANGYDAFPDTLKNAQVAIPARDLAGIERIAGSLPAGWALDSYLFSIGRTAITVTRGEEVVLEIFVLTPRKDEGAEGEFSAAMKKIRASMRSRNFPLKLLNSLTRRKFDTSLKAAARKRAKRSFRELNALACDHPEESGIWCDTLTSKLGVVLPAEALDRVEELTCGGVSYPVFSGWRGYLEHVYGDYEKGLTDEIGCGLTVEEKAELKRHQDRCRQALAFVQQLSQEFGLRYYLLAGSVLGAVRDGGFIPWDDDVDLGIRIEDIRHFEEVVREQLPQRLPAGFALVQSGPNNGYPRMFSKICYEGRCCIDLWPLVPTYKEGFAALATWGFGKIITKVHYKKLGVEATRFARTANLMAAVMPDRLVLWCARFNERKYRNRKTPAYINLYSIYTRQKETIDRRWLDEKATANFDGLEVPVVGCTHEYLTHLYGNYMGRPAPWKRASRHTSRFEANS